MTESDLKKKESRPKRSSDRTGETTAKTTFPTLARIVLSNGSVVELPELPTTSSPLTTYDHLSIALEYGALAICWLQERDLDQTPRLMLSQSLAPLRLNLDDLMNHLYYAIEGFPKETGSS